ncbi:MAG: hypothetical protein OET08_11575 [Desulfuromonadales bacterium]|nr:hypothetical protein [Desulfuromonadales bacterium]
MAKTLSQKSSFRLFLWGMVLVPFAVISDVILDAVLFSDGSIQEQLFSPTTQEVAIRLLFSTFILAAIYLGIHISGENLPERGSPAEQSARPVSSQAGH